MEKQFIEASKKGNLELVRDIYRHNPTIDISAENESAFRWAIYYGHLEVVKQLYTWKPTINISVGHESAFRYACYNGHLEVVRQLYLWKPTINTSGDYELAFRSACQSGHLEVVRQLYQWKPTIDISANNEEAFRWACKNGHLEVVRQLYQWKPTIDILHIDLSVCDIQIRKYIKELLGINHWIDIKIEITPDDNIECPICYTKITDEYLTTPCSHSFCVGCIIKWYETNNICPYCRNNI